MEFFNTFINQKPDDPYSLDYLDYSAAQAYHSLMQFHNDYEIDQIITNDNGVFGSLQVNKKHLVECNLKKVNITFFH